MTYVDINEFQWQAVKDKDGARIEVRCPLCGTILFQVLQDLADADSPDDIIGDILQWHWEMKLCGSPEPVIDLMQAMPETAGLLVASDYEQEDGTMVAEGKTILDSVIKGYDDALWHVSVATDEFGEVQRNVEMLPAPMEVNYFIVLEEAERRAAEYHIGLYNLLTAYYSALPTP